MTKEELKEYGQCIGKGKVQHASRKTAKEALLVMRRKFPNTTASIYKCPYCYYWHIGKDGKK